MFLYLLAAISTIMVIGAAQLHEPLCDPDTQYAEHGQCCDMCGPGKKMSINQCINPICEECEENEYQDKYTKESKCKRQPYCDPNKNFLVSVNKNKETKTICMCKPGFHCSSKECITCIPHSQCEPGQEVVFEGNQTHDTVCRPCPSGEFVDKNSVSRKCVKHTECEPGFYVKETGTNQSDTVCDQRLHLSVIIAMVLFGVILVIAVLVYIYRAKIRSSSSPKQNHDVEPVTDIKVVEEQTPCISTPVENDDPGVSSEDHGITENGNCVTQEFGPLEKLSRQESQQSSTCILSLESN